MLDGTQVLTLLGAIAVAGVTGFFSWAAGSRSGNAQMAQVLQSGLKDLISELRSEHIQDTQENERLRTRIGQLSEEIGELRNYIAEVMAWIRLQGLEKDAPRMPLPKLNGS